MIQDALLTKLYDAKRTLTENGEVDFEELDNAIKTRVKAVMGELDVKVPDHLTINPSMTYKENRRLLKRSYNELIVLYRRANTRAQELSVIKKGLRELLEELPRLEK